MKKFKKMYLASILLIPMLFFTTGCYGKYISQEEYSSSVSMGMSKQDLINKLGSKRCMTRGSVVNKNKELVELVEIYVSENTGLFRMMAPEAHAKTYWVFLKNGRVSHWGSPGDWGTSEGDKYKFDIKF